MSAETNAAVHCFRDGDRRIRIDLDAAIDRFSGAQRGAHKNVHRTVDLARIVSFVEMSQPARNEGGKGANQRRRFDIPSLYQHWHPAKPPAHRCHAVDPERMIMGAAPRTPRLARRLPRSAA
jgi:hypothetical protein